MGYEKDAIIIKEHARLRAQVAALAKTGDASLEAILGLLHPIERDTAYPQRTPIK